MIKNESILKKNIGYLLLVIGLTIFCTFTLKTEAAEKLLYDLPGTSATLTYTIDSSTQTATITEVSSLLMSELIFPSEINGYRVTKIGSGTSSIYKASGNQNASYLTTIIIPEGVSEIGKQAFSGFGTLESISLPNSLEKIGGGFISRTAIQSITIPKNVTSAGAALGDATNLTTVSFESGMRSIPRRIFASYSYNYKGAGIEWVYIPNSVEVVEEYAFYYCNNLKTISLPDTIKEVQKGAFYGCSSLTRASLPSDIQTLSDSLFAECTNLRDVTIPNSVREIGEGVFYKCSSLQSILIPSSIEKIGKKAFMYCSALKDVHLSTGLVSVGSQAFYGCENLEALVIPESVNQIGVEFIRGTAIQKVLMPRNLQICSYVGATKDLIYSTTSFGIFSGATKLNEVEFSDGITSIPRRATACSGTEKSNITSIIIPLSVKTISEYALDTCVSLTDIYYAGSKYDWDMIAIDESNQEVIANARIHFGTTSSPEQVTINVYSDNSAGSIAIGQDIAFMPKLVKEGKEQDTDQLWNFSIDNTNIAAVVSTEISEGLEFVRVKGINQGCAHLTILHIPSGKSIIIPIFVSNGFHNYDLSMLPKSGTIVHSGIAMRNFSYYPDGSGGYNVTFDAFNTLQSIATVEVYNAEHKVEKVVKIDKHDYYPTDMIEFTEMTFYLMQYTFSMVDNDYNELFGKNTRVTIHVPKNGFFIVSNDMSSSVSCNAYNRADVDIEFMLQGIDIVKNVNSQLFANEAKEQIEKSVLEYLVGIDPQKDVVDKYLQKVGKTVTKKMTKSALKDFLSDNLKDADSFFADMNINLEEIMVNTAAKFGVGTMQGAIESNGGPAGLALKGIFKADELLNVLMQSIHMNKAIGMGDARFYVSGNAKVNSGIIVNYTSSGKSIENADVIVVDISENNDSQFEYYITELSHVTKHKIYDITLYRDGYIVQPDGQITVKIPLPALYDKDKCRIYRKEYDGSLTDMSAVYEDGYMVFETNHLSVYLLVEASGFSDVVSGSYYEEAINWAISNNITSGIGNNMFGVNQTVTRAQAVTFLYKYAGAPLGAPTSPFVDVNIEWQKPGVNWAASDGVTVGTSATTFNPEDAVTRGQAMAFFFRTAKAPDEYTSSFSDVTPENSFYKHVSWGAANKITVGIGDNLFGINLPIKRQDFVVMLYRMNTLLNDT